MLECKQSAPNLVKMYVTIRSRMRLIMDLIWVICPWICKYCWIWLCLYHSIYKCRPISTKHGHSIFDDEFDYGSNLTVTSRVICPWIRKNCLTHYQTTNFRLFQTERVGRRQFHIWRKWQKAFQTGRKHSGQRRIARYEQFLLFPQCFLKACFPGASKSVIVWEWVNLTLFTL